MHENALRLFCLYSIPTWNFRLRMTTIFWGNYFTEFNLNDST